MKDLTTLSNYALTVDYGADQPALECFRELNRRVELKMEEMKSFTDQQLIMLLLIRLTCEPSDVEHRAARRMASQRLAKAIADTNQFTPPANSGQCVYCGQKGHHIGNCPKAAESDLTGPA